jgi:hypothetical protein
LDRRKSRPKDADAELKLIRDYDAVFNNPGGENVLADIRAKSGFDSTTLLVPGCPDATAHNLGLRAMYCYIIEQLSKDPDEARPDKAETEEDEE